MIAAAYYDENTGLASKLLSGADLSAFPQAENGELALLVSPSSLLPGYVSEGVYFAMPKKPDVFYVWQGFPDFCWQIDFALLKSEKKKWVKNHRDSLEFSHFFWNGSGFDADMVSRMRLQQAFEKAKRAIEQSESYEQPWKLADNSVIILSAQDVLGVYMAAGELTANAHAIAGTLEVLIDLCSTVEQVQAITWPQNT